MWQWAIMLAAAAYFGSDLLDWATDRITAYPAMCSDGGAILPPSIAVRQSTGYRDATAAMNKAYRDCAIIPLNRITYVLNRVRAEAIYDNSVGGAPGKLVNCSILDRSNWSCEYPDYASGIYRDKPYSGKLVFVDGRPAIHGKEAGSETMRVFYMRRWQWWVVNVLGVFTHPVQSRWLIPEQREHF